MGIEGGVSSYHAAARDLACEANVVKHQDVHYGDESFYGLFRSQVFEALLKY